MHYLNQERIIFVCFCFAIILMKSCLLALCKGGTFVFPCFWGIKVTSFWWLKTNFLYFLLLFSVMFDIFSNLFLARIHSCLKSSFLLSYYIALYQGLCLVIFSVISTTFVLSLGKKVLLLKNKKGKWEK